MHRKDSHLVFFNCPLESIRYYEQAKYLAHKLDSTKKGYESVLSVMFLVEHGTKTTGTSIGVECLGFPGISKCQDRSRGKFTENGLKGSLTFR